MKGNGNQSPLFTFFKSRFPHMETSPLVVKGSKLSVYALHLRPSNNPGGILIVPYLL